MTVDKVIAKIMWLTFLAHPVETPIVFLSLTTQRLATQRAAVMEIRLKTLNS